MLRSEQMSKTVLLIIFTLSVVPVSGQTVSEIERAYGKPTSAYSVTEHIWMTPDFATDGQVCRMRFFPKQVERGTVYLNGGYLRFEELKRILNHIVPPSSRGNRKSSFGIGDLGGGIIQTDFEYEKVTFTFVDSLNIKIDADFLKRGDPVLLDFPDDYVVVEPPKPPPPAESDFDLNPRTQIVILRWNDRTCAQEDDARPEQGLAMIEQRFGQPQKIYSVSSFASMTPAFTAGGKVCQMWVYPKRVSGINNYLGTTLHFNQLLEFLNELVPPEKRGLKEKLNFGTTATGGNFVWTTYPYKNVSFTFWAASQPAKPADLESLLRKGEFTFTIPYPPQPVINNPLPSAEDFQPTDTKEVAIISWRHRKCAGF